MIRSRSPLATLVALLAMFALLAGACGDDDASVASSGDAADTTEPDTSEPDETPDSEPVPDESTAFPVTVTSGGVETTVEELPESIISLSPSGTEMLFAIDAGGQVVAVDSFSTFPEEAPVTDLSGFEPNLEAIIGYEPDLVILSGDRNDVVAGLAAVDVPALILPAAVTLEDSYDQIELLGDLTGHPDDADALVTSMTDDIAELVASVPDRDEPLTFFHELDSTLYTVTSDTFIGEVYEMAGLVNIADEADPDGELGGYPQISTELLISANPDLIFLADAQCCDQDAETVAARPGYDQIAAVQQGQVFVLDEDVASRWGPRVVEFLASIVEATASVGV